MLLLLLPTDDLVTRHIEIVRINLLIHQLAKVTQGENLYLLLGFVAFVIFIRVEFLFGFRDVLALSVIILFYC